MYILISVKIGKVSTTTLQVLYLLLKGGQFEVFLFSCEDRASADTWAWSIVIYMCVEVKSMTRWPLQQVAPTQRQRLLSPYGSWHYSHLKACPGGTEWLSGERAASDTKSLSMSELKHVTPPSPSIFPEFTPRVGLERKVDESSLQCCNPYVLHQIHHLHVQGLFFYQCHSNIKTK